jgi:hypothetical protein
METQADRLAEILGDEVNRHEYMAAGDKVLAAMMLIGDIISAVDCPGCREMITALIDREMRHIIESWESRPASEENAEAKAADKKLH